MASGRRRRPRPQFDRSASTVSCLHVCPRRHRQRCPRPGRLRVAGFNPERRADVVAETHADRLSASVGLALGEPDPDRDRHVRAG
jgi:hypothetical protein